ncbi:MAG: hypothetical protein LQ347_000615 [Umbilicaria vellea]|nr:MAG: hypothetical protein LQ347_000615 [Umbilicaria vellea]
MAKTRSQTASRASVMRVARAANTATPRRQRSAGKASTTNNQRRLPRIILRLGPPPIAAEEALSIARHDRQVGRPHIILRLNRAPAAGLEFQAIARPGARLHIILRMGLRPTAAEELEALSRHDRLRGRQPANTGMGRAPRMVALGKSSFLTAQERQRSPHRETQYSPSPLAFEAEYSKQRGQQLQPSSGESRSKHPSAAYDNEADVPKSGRLDTGNDSHGLCEPGEDGSDSWRGCIDYWRPNNYAALQRTLNTALQSGRQWHVQSTPESVRQPTYLTQAASKHPSTPAIDQYEIPDSWDPTDGLSATGKNKYRRVWKNALEKRRDHGALLLTEDIAAFISQAKNKVGMAIPTVAEDCRFVYLQIEHI